MNTLGYANIVKYLSVTRVDFTMQNILNQHIQYVAAIVLLNLICISASSAQSAKSPGWDVKIVGNKTYSELVLKSILAIEGKSFIERITTLNVDNRGYTREEAERDRIRLMRFYQRRGFPDIKVDLNIELDEQKNRFNVVFTLEEGRPILIQEVYSICRASAQDSTEIYNSRRFSRTMRRLSYREGRRFEEVKQSEVQGRIIEALNNLGYYRASSGVSYSIDSLNYSAEVRIEIDPGEKVYVDSIYVSGTEEIKDRYYLHETGINPGDLYSKGDLENAQRELYNHHMVRFVTVDVIEKEQPDLVDLQFNVYERDLRSLQYSVGVGFDRDLNNEFIEALRQIRGQVSWSYRDASNRGHRFQTTIRASGFDQGINFNYLFPYIFNTKSSILLVSSFEHLIEPSYEIITGGLQGNFIYQYTRLLTTTLGYEFTVNNQLTRNAQEQLPDSVLNYNVSSLSVSALYRDRVFANREGWIIQPYLEYSGPFGEADYTFQKVAMDIRRLERLGNSLSFAARVQGGMINYAGQDSLPQNIRFFNGGTSKVRGYARDQLGPKRPVFNEAGDFALYLPVGGRATYTFSVELRQRIDKLIKGVEITGFLDGGALWRNVSDVNLDATRFGTGGGIRYRSPIGPIRIEFAHKVNPTLQDKNFFNGQDFGNFWDRNRIHFSVGSSF